MLAFKCPNPEVSKWQNEAQQEDPSALTTWAPGLWNFFQGPFILDKRHWYN